MDLDSIMDMRTLEDRAAEIVEQFGTTDTERNRLMYETILSLLRELSPPKPHELAPDHIEA